MAEYLNAQTLYGRIFECPNVIWQNIWIPKRYMAEYLNAQTMPLSETYRTEPVPYIKAARHVDTDKRHLISSFFI